MLWFDRIGIQNPKTVIIQTLQFNDRKAFSDDEPKWFSLVNSTARSHGSKYLPFETDKVLALHKLK